MQVQQLGLAEGQLYTIWYYLQVAWSILTQNLAQSVAGTQSPSCCDMPIHSTARGRAPTITTYLYIGELCRTYYWVHCKSGLQGNQAVLPKDRLSSMQSQCWSLLPMMALFTSRKLVVTTSWKDSILPCSSVWTLQSEPDKRVWQIGRVPRLCRDTCKYRIPNRSLMTATHFSRLFSNWVSEIYQLFPLFRRVKRGIADELGWFADKRNPKIWNFETESITSRGCWRWAWLSYFHSDHTEFHIPSIISFLLDLFGTMLARWMASTLRTMYISYALKYIKNSKHKTVHVFFAQNHGFDTSTQK